MLYLKEANFEDIEKEYLFVRDIPVDENGFINEWTGVEREEFGEKVLKTMIAYSNGENLPTGLVPETYFFLWYKDEDKYYVRIKKSNLNE